MANDERDNRLDQIKEGAGLEDSRINQEFIDFVRKWSTPVLLLAALISLGYFLNNKRIESRATRIDEAFQQYNLTTQTLSPSPDALKQIAQDYRKVEGVYLLATQRAADEYLRAVQRGVKPGVSLTQTGEIENEEDLLTPEDRARFLNEAEALYKEVHAATAGHAKYGLHTLGALYGLAAVAESRGDTAAAQNVLDQAAALADSLGYLEQHALAKVRIAALPSLGEVASLPRKADLPEIPALQPTPIVIPEITPAETEVGPQLPEGAGETPTETPTEDPAAGPGDGQAEPPDSEPGQPAGDPGEAETGDAGDGNPPDGEGSGGGGEGGTSDGG